MFAFRFLSSFLFIFVLIACGSSETKESSSGSTPMSGYSSLSSSPPPPTPTATLTAATAAMLTPALASTPDKEGKELVSFSSKSLTYPSINSIFGESESVNQPIINGTLFKIGDIKKNGLHHAYVEGKKGIASIIFMPQFQFPIQGPVVEFVELIEPYKGCYTLLESGLLYRIEE